MNYSQAIAFLHGLQMFGARPGLERVQKLAAALGDPQKKLRFIHVAGTNGKGSVCAMLESIYRHAGLHVGLFTSPHLVAFGERMQVNRLPIFEADIARLVAQVERGSVIRSTPQAKEASESLKALDEVKRCGSQTRAPMGRLEAGLTFFEFVTAMALPYFAEQRCDLVIWETGLGGRLDATNIVTPLASVITNIQFDHEKWLGETLAQIAGEKAGIIKPGVPVITATDAPEALAVIQETAQRLNSPLTVVTPAEARAGLMATLQLPLLGEHQKLNAAVALATVAALQKILPVSEAALRAGLEQVRWAGRLQVIERPGQTLLLDGAHNVAGVESLCAALAQHFPGRRPALVMGVLADKDWKRIAERLAPLCKKIFTVPVASERTVSAVKLAETFRLAGQSADACASLAEALPRVGHEPFVVIAGSLYLIGEAMELLGLLNAAGGERALNEWGAMR